MASAEPPKPALCDSGPEGPKMLGTSALELQPTQKIPRSPNPGMVDKHGRDPVPTGSTFSAPPTTEEDIGSDSQASMPNDSMRPTKAPVTSSPDRIEPSNPIESSSNPASVPTFNFGLKPSEEGQHSNGPTSPKQLSPPALSREKTAPAIGPATDKPTPLPSELEMEGPALFITLLLASTGTRHPYRLDEKYLKKRNVVVEGNNPINISLYKLKELILRDWRDEWEAKPSSPESIRLISMGKMLNDKQKLSDSGFTNGATPHIVHMSVKPQDIVDEEDARLKAGGKDREGNERTPGCRCIIM